MQQKDSRNGRDMEGSSKLAGRCGRRRVPSAPAFRPPVKTMRSDYWRTGRQGIFSQPVPVLDEVMHMLTVPSPGDTAPRPDCEPRPTDEEKPAVVASCLRRLRSNTRHVKDYYGDYERWVLFRL